MKAEIKWIIDGDNKEGLWMEVGGEEGTMWAIEENEVEAIKEACEVWLEQESQRILLDSIKPKR
jgi:hypothetical protein